jgi:hypothetical protein
MQVNDTLAIAEQVMFELSRQSGHADWIANVCIWIKADITQCCGDKSYGSVNDVYRKPRGGVMVRQLNIYVMAGPMSAFGE